MVAVDIDGSTTLFRLYQGTCSGNVANVSAFDCVHVLTALVEAEPYRYTENAEPVFEILKL